jgi:hypothetical protein
MKGARVNRDGIKPGERGIAHRTHPEKISQKNSQKKQPFFPLLVLAYNLLELYYTHMTRQQWHE